MPFGQLHTSDDLLICTACGTQYDTTDTLPSADDRFNSAPQQRHVISTIIPGSETSLRLCRICDDPRQYVPAGGQTFTTLGRLKAAAFHEDHGGISKVAGKGYRNILRRSTEDAKVIEMWTEPKIGIGQRACIIQTPHGNVMWDAVAYLDQDTVDQINDLGGLEFIIISHPHFYTTWADWSTTFSCPVYMAEVDARSWANRVPESVASPLPAKDVMATAKTRNTGYESPSTVERDATDGGEVQPMLRFIRKTYTTLLPGLTAIKAGGHFPGSMLLHSAPPNTELRVLFTADTMTGVPSASNPEFEKDEGNEAEDGNDDRDSDSRLYTKNRSSVNNESQRKRQTSSYTFMWSYPNMIPLDPDSIHGIWKALHGKAGSTKTSPVTSGGKSKLDDNNSQRHDDDDETTYQDCNLDLDFEFDISYSIAAGSVIKAYRRPPTTVVHQSSVEGPPPPPPSGEDLKNSQESKSPSHGLKRRVLQSMQLYVSRAGWVDHPLLREVF